MQILLNPDGSYPQHLTEDQIDALKQAGARFVRPTVPPASLAGGVLVEDDPALINGEWVQQWKEQAVEAPPPADPKLTGVEFEGVMCSATNADQAGLTAVLLAIQLQGAAFPATRFKFDNGNEVVIHLGNYQAFMATWLPFRQSFFRAE